jgi:hypothetical protein
MSESPIILPFILRFLEGGIKIEKFTHNLWKERKEIMNIHTIIVIIWRFTFFDIIY